MAQAPFVTSPALTAVSLDYGTVNSRSRGYIADQVMPRVRVDAPDFKYPSYPIEEAFDAPDVQAGRRSKLNEFLLTATEATGSVEDFGLSAPIPYRDEMASRASSLPFSLRARATRTLVDKVQLAREKRVAAKIFSAGNYQTGYKATVTGSGAGGQWDTSGSTPVKDILDAKASMLIPPNVGIMGERVFRRLRLNASVSTALGGSAGTGRMIPLDELASILGLERLIIGNTIQQTSKKGQALTTSPIWGDHFALLRVAPVNGTGTVDNPEDPSFGYTFQWGDQVAGENQDPDIGLLGGVRVRFGEMLKETIVAPYSGYLFTNAVGA